MTCDDGTKNTPRKKSRSPFFALWGVLSFFLSFFLLLLLLPPPRLGAEGGGGGAHRRRERERQKERERNNGVTKFNWIGLDWIFPIPVTKKKYARFPFLVSSLVENARFRAASSCCCFSAQQQKRREKKKKKTSGSSREGGGRFVEEGRRL